MHESSTHPANMAQRMAEGKLQDAAPWQRAWAVVWRKGFADGNLASAKRWLRMLCDEAFGVPDARTAARFERIDDLTDLEGILLRVPFAASWQELLGPMPSQRRAASPRSTRTNRGGE
jgi:hypothetical protein